MEFLAFITFTFCAVESPSRCTEPVTTLVPVECVSFGDAVSVIVAHNGETTNYTCEYTRAPAKSMRPVARPVERDS